MPYCIPSCFICSLTFSQAYRPIRSGPLARKVLLPPWAERSRSPEGHSSPAPGPRLPWHTKARAGAPQLPGGFPRRNSSRWRRPLENAEQSWPRRRPGAPGGEPSWDEPCGEQGREGALKIPGGVEGVGRERGEKEEANLREPANFIGLKSFFCCRLPLACGAVPCVRCFWKVGSSHIPRRFSRHLTRRGGGGGGGRGRDADRHHPARRTHSRALPATAPRPGLGARARSERDSPAQVEAPRRSTLSCRLVQSILKTLEKKRSFPKGWGKGEPGG